MGTAEPAPGFAADVPGHLGRPPAQVEITAERVRGQLQRIDGQLAALPLRYLATGWDNAVFRLGEQLLVRAPRRQQAEQLAANEHRWLPVLARDTGLELPVLLYRGIADESYPFTLSVCRYLPGRSALGLARERRDAYAGQLTEYLAALHVPAPAEAPRSAFRGMALEQIDADTRRRLETLPQPLCRKALRIWDSAVAAPCHTGPLVWLHGDPHPHNTVVRDADGGDALLVGLVDFGDLCAGDPASDLGMLWMHFTPGVRNRALLRQVQVPADGLWQRARGWALRYSVILAALAATDELGQLGRSTLRILLEGEAQRPAWG